MKFIFLLLITAVIATEATAQSTDTLSNDSVISYAFNEVFTSTNSAIRKSDIKITITDNEVIITPQFDTTFKSRYNIKSKIVTRDSNNKVVTRYFLYDHVYFMVISQEGRENMASLQGQTQYISFYSKL